MDWEELRQGKAATKATVSWLGGKANLITTLSSDPQPQQEQVINDKESILGTNTNHNGKATFVSICRPSNYGEKTKQEKTENGKANYVTGKNRESKSDKKSKGKSSGKRKSEERNGRIKLWER